MPRYLVAPVGVLAAFGLTVASAVAYVVVAEAMAKGKALRHADRIGSQR